MKTPGGTFQLPEEAKKWTIHEIQIWCRKNLCGAPPAKPRDPQNNIELKWKEVGGYAGKRIDLHSEFAGLIMNDIFHMAREGTPPMTQYGARSKGSDSILQNITDPDIINSLEEVNVLFWNGVEELVEWYNPDKMKHRHTVEMSWRAGKEMHDLKNNINEKIGDEYVTNSNLRHSVEKWGVGLRGYTNHQINNCIAVYRWLGESNSNHPIMKYKVNPINKLLNEPDLDRRMNLFQAYHCGPLNGLKGTKLSWAVGLEENKFPDTNKWLILRKYSEKLASGVELTREETEDLWNILDSTENRK